MQKSFPNLLPSLIFAILLFFIPGRNEVSAYSTDSETQSVILYVKPGTNGTCTSWADACELQTALFNAAVGDQIWVAAGTYKPTASTNREATFQLMSGVAIYGGFPAAGGEWFQRNWLTNLTILSGDIGVFGNTGDNSYHVVTGSGVDATAVLDGFTVSGGNADGGNETVSGGGMYNSGGSPSLTNVTFDSNSAQYGGGLYNYSGSPSLTAVIFTGNTSIYGGGMYNTNSSSPSLNNVTFSDNSATYDGGGIYNGNSSPTLADVTISGNTASDAGGGLFNTNSSTTLTNVTILGNRANNGGGLCNTNNSNVTLTNVTISGNISPAGYGFGGGLYNHNGSVATLTQVTFSENQAIWVGGGMANFYSNSTMSNVTFIGNTADYQGGGLINERSELLLLNVNFYQNSAGSAGGMFDYESNSQLTGVTFAGNSATTGDGGGLWNQSSINIYNVTFTENTAADYGGAVYNNSYGDAKLTNVTISGNSSSSQGGGMTSWGNAIVNNAIFWGNTPGQIQGSATVSFSDIQGGYSGTSNINADPFLGPLVDNGGFTQTQALGAGSAAIDVADPSFCTNIDQRAYARPIDGDGDGTATCDMGAYEYASSPATFSLTLDIVGSGSVLKDPDKTEYLWGELVTLTPVADPDWVFIGWGGDSNGMENPLTITLYDDINISANFVYYLSSLSVSALPELSGTISTDPNLPIYPTGSQVTITADPNPGWEFIGWSGDASGTENPLTNTMFGDTEIVANFEPGEYTLSVAANPASFGSVTVEPEQVTYHYGDQVLLTAIGSADHVLANWSGDASGSVNPLLVTITGNMDITANFYCLLTVTVFPDGGGSVIVLPDQASFPYGSSVTLTAVPNPGWTFIGWSGNASGTHNPITLTMNDNLEITANFSQIEYSLSVSVNPVGLGNVTKSPNKPYYYYGEVVTLTASPTVTGWRFIDWSGDASGVTNPLQITITGNNNIIANFSDQYTLTTIVDPLDSGTITRDIYQDTYTYGTQVVLTATPSLGWTFDGWGGDGSGSDNPLTYTIVGDTSITATFTQNEYTLVVNVEPVGSGTVNIYPMQTTYHYGDEVTLTSVANSGWTFLEWSGDATGSDNPLTVTIHGDTNITANFMQDQYTLDVTIEGFGSVAIDPVQATYIYGTEVTLTATADPSWRFVGWSGDASGSDNPLIFTIQGNTSITALFTTNWIFLPMITR